MRVEGSLVGVSLKVEPAVKIDNNKKHCKICGRPIDKEYGCWCTGCVVKHRRTLEEGKGIHIDMSI